MFRSELEDLKSLFKDLDIEDKGEIDLGEMRSRKKKAQKKEEKKKKIALENSKKITAKSGEHENQERKHTNYSQRNSEDFETEANTTTNSTYISNHDFYHADNDLESGRSSSVRKLSPDRSMKV